MKRDIINVIKGLKVDDILGFTTFRGSKGTIYIRSFDIKEHGFSKTKFITYAFVTNLECRLHQHHEEYMTNIFEELHYLDNKNIPDMEIMNLTDTYAEVLVWQI